MAKSAGKGEGVDPLQIRLNPRIHKLISERTKAHGTTMKAEIEELIVKGEQLEKMMGQRGRIGMEVLLRVLDGDSEGAVRKLLEFGADHRRLENVIKTFRLNTGIDPMPEFQPLTPGDRQ